MRRTPDLLSFRAFFGMSVFRADDKHLRCFRPLWSGPGFLLKRSPLASVDIAVHYPAAAVGWQLTSVNALLFLLRLF